MSISNLRKCIDTLLADIVTCFNNETDYYNNLAVNIYPELQNHCVSPQIFTQRAILTPKNDDVDRINDILIAKFKGTPTIYKSFDSVIDDQCNTYPIEYLNTLCPSGMSPHKLVLKENYPVILLRNLDPSSGMCNGTRLICKRFLKNLIHYEIATGYYKG